MRPAVGKGVQTAIREQFRSYDLTAKTWDALTKSHGQSRHGGVTHFEEEGIGLLNLGSQRYKILVPSYTVMFSFFLVLTIGWLFVAERRQGTLKRLLPHRSRAWRFCSASWPLAIRFRSARACAAAGGQTDFPDELGQRAVVVDPRGAVDVIGGDGHGRPGGVGGEDRGAGGHLRLAIGAGAGGPERLLDGQSRLMPEAMQQISRMTPLAWSLDRLLAIDRETQPGP